MSTLGPRASTDKLGELETSVLEVLWAAKAPQSVREVHAALERRRPLAYTTILTVLDRLHGSTSSFATGQGAHFCMRRGSATRPSPSAPSRLRHAQPARKPC
jgi:hypothetical protein